MRKVLLGGIAGAVPGLLVALIPLVLSSLDVITSDESQVGFIGVPLFFIGVFVGTLIGARDLPHPGRVMLGVLVGFVVGLAGGIAISGAASAGPLWLFVAPAAMIAGGALGARGDEGSIPPQRPAAQH
jgi:uncharacterized protein YqgC (DUF456 family)